MGSINFLTQLAVEWISKKDASALITLFIEQSDGSSFTSLASKPY
ncbi:MAG TPA: hypothetical protein VIA09_05520 [Nitrososphaeraceae archaeon]